MRTGSTLSLKARLRTAIMYNYLRLWSSENSLISSVLEALYTKQITHLCYISSRRDCLYLVNLCVHSPQYITVIYVVSVLMYGFEAWTLTKNNRKQLECFERKVLRKIFGAVKDNWLWRKRYNHEVYELYQDLDIMKTIKISRLRWDIC